MKKQALVVLSGGQDSVTCLALAIKQHGAENVAALTFDYGQTHSREIAAAVRVAQLAGIRSAHEILVLPGNTLHSTSPLVNREQPLERYDSYAQMDAIIGDRVEKTFVPMRNALFLTIAANRAVELQASELYTGVCQADNANYPDCRESFVLSQEATLHEALGFTGLHITTPLLHLSKAASIYRLMRQCGPEMFCWLAWSHTAYDGQYPPVGRDHASVLRAHGFMEAGVPDPLVLRAALFDKLMHLPETSNYQDLRTVDGLLPYIEEAMATLGGGGQALGEVTEGQSA